MSSIRSLSTKDLRKEIDRRERGAVKMQRQHAKLAKRIEAIERELEDLGGAPVRQAPRTASRKVARKARRGRKSTRGGGGHSMIGEALAKAVKPGQTVSPTEALKLMQSSGYKPGSKNNAAISVAMRLRDDPNFKKVGRGQYKRLPAAKS